MFLPEPPFRHDQPERIGVLLINLGTPAAPTARALRPYLREFLSDRRVIELPRGLWWPILHGVILNTRPRRSAEKYASIWTPEGSPLLTHTQRQARLLAEALRARSPVPILVDYAMRYGAPSVAEVYARLRAQGCTRLLALPLYPQYAASSTASALDALWRVLLKSRNVPEVRTIRHFHDHPGYIAALRQRVEGFWAEHGRPEVLVMSFHGVPRASLEQGDPYHCECHKTARLLAEALGLAPSEYRVAFQSRFGRAEWLQPYTAETLQALGRQRTRRVDVICPGFVADCLETLEEIALEGKAAFLNAGGGEYRYIPALNEHPLWIDALTELVLQHLAGWLPSHWDAGAEAQEAALRQARARALGARD
ncbi:MAG: ferrochelatase [Thiobacillaceae bacterium]|nr:ferrochelatase [Thiobacillaceae bacterium]MCX7672070.1 ferrochelatase [Thiobacillaceae bacterium]MDW8324337.1 ferrochelatase [Burkholderiales bacterium]